ncbi:hypothetical protein [Deinococcus sp. QL22]|uniref:hypothetical protein n=1 Tax=Deinococcus sp. QL22 TaxID=2939437 RepID=UPI002017A0C1|nr:hypothetical protein [Deinococcus sp. QL22]UQN06519.1 hypothetical protein M1R55_00955 [Deinococcus sp. QL22]
MQTFWWQTLCVLSLLSSSASAAGILGTAQRLETTNFCKTYRCRVEGRVEAGNGYIRTHLSLLPSGASESDYRWNVYELTRQGRVVGARWEARYQDDFFFAPEASMVTALSRSVLGMALPGSATQTLVNNAMGGTADPTKSSYRAGELVVEAFSRGVGNSGEFQLILTSQAERGRLRAIDPPRVALSPQEKQTVMNQLIAALGTFYRVAPDCPADLFRSAVAVPLGDGMTEARVRGVVEGLGFEYMLGTYWREGFPATPLHVALHPNGREVCVGF